VRSPCGEVWLDDITINGDKEDFGRDPGWDQLNNRRTYTTTLVRPRFDFGYSPTRHAGGKGIGELGGVIFRGDCRSPDKMASYADRLDELTLDKPLRASGKVPAHFQRPFVKRRSVQSTRKAVPCQGVAWRSSFW
jgi:hypothetical protein